MRSRAVLLSGLVALLLVPGALGHAKPDTSHPPPGGQLPDSPGEVQITFTQTPDPEESWIRVFDADGERVDEGSTRVDADTAAVVLPEDLGEGGYKVEWQALSKVDGHTTRGSFGFAVGEARAPETSGIEELEPSAFDIAGKAAAYLGFAAAAGAVVFDRFVQRSAEDRWWRGYLVAGAAVHLAGVVTLAASQTVASELAPTRYLTETGFGRGLSLRVILGAGLLGLAVFPSRSPRMERGRRLGLSASILGLAFAYGAYGHTQAFMGTLFLGATLDAIHMLTVAAWAGGLGALWLLLGHGRAREATAQRFSRLATVCLVVSLGTGLWMLDTVVGLAPAKLLDAWGTDYALLLYLKIGLFGIMASLGALNRFVHIEGLDLPGLPAGRFRSAVHRETLVAILVLVSAGAATNFSPPGEDLGVGSPEAVHFEDNSSTYVFNATLDPGPRAFQVSEFTVNVTYADNGTSVTNAFRLEAVFDPGSNGSTTEIRLADRGNGTFNATGAYFTEAGEWNVTMTIQTRDVYKEEVTFRVDVPDRSRAEA
jgi:putative copper export protein/methionine-rich copper-binding protein CopC